ncbi:MAG: 2-amino-4-hydroxy-6-hydroxymethyldihydropteridine diphosphokinase [Synergistaceae bacterium]|nr:2-amino-4-hydroxy-6-hydroxymethyldihydropteridine diphosphokinase [Synergistaceae bacterium]
MSSEAALSLGANVGDRLRNLRIAVEMMGLRVGSVISRSCVYETPPWGVESQPFFLNACVMIDTELSAKDLLEGLKSIESEIGRVPRGRWGPREIDIDILTYANLRYADDTLVIPHPRLSERTFVLVPLRDIAPLWIHPQSGLPISDILDKMDLRGIVRITRL